LITEAEQKVIDEAARWHQARIRVENAEANDSLRGSTYMERWAAGQALDNLVKACEAAFG